jgi:hypothetical protein
LRICWILDANEKQPFLDFRGLCMSPVAKTNAPAVNLAVQADPLRKRPHRSIYHQSRCLICLLAGTIRKSSVQSLGTEFCAQCYEPSSTKGWLIICFFRHGTLNHTPVKTNSKSSQRSFGWPETHNLEAESQKHLHT